MGACPWHPVGICIRSRRWLHCDTKLLVCMGVHSFGLPHAQETNLSDLYARSLGSVISLGAFCRRRFSNATKAIGAKQLRIQGLSAAFEVAARCGIVCPTSNLRQSGLQSYATYDEKTGQYFEPKWFIRMGLQLQGAKWNSLFLWERSSLAYAQDAPDPKR